jgi:hypothetical protein
MGEFLAKEIYSELPRVRFAIGVIGIIGYLGKLPIIDSLGLTSRVVASQPLLGRGRPGHEKHATLESLLTEGASFSDEAFWPGHEEDLRLGFRPFTFFLVHHDPALQDLARKRGWGYPDPLAQASKFVSEPHSRAEYEERQAFSTRFLSGTPVLEPVLALLGSRLDGSFLKDVDPLTLSSEQLPEKLELAESFGLPLAGELAKRVVFRLDFERDDEAKPVAVEGSIWPPVAGPQGVQSPLYGLSGKRLVDTFHPDDQATGRLEWALPSGAGLTVSLLVGGGAGCEKTAAVLYDGPKEVARWCGRNDERLRRVQAPLSGLAAPRLVIVDQETNGWGHLLVDDVMVVRDGPAP